MGLPERETQTMIDEMNRGGDGWFDFCGKMRQILTSLNVRVGIVEKQEDKQPGTGLTDATIGLSVRAGNLDTAGRPSNPETDLVLALDKLNHTNAFYSYVGIGLSIGREHFPNPKNPPPTIALTLNYVPSLNDGPPIQVKEGDWWDSPTGLCQMVNGEWVMTIPKPEGGDRNQDTAGHPPPVYVETKVLFDGLGTYTRAQGDPPTFYSPDPPTESGVDDEESLQASVPTSDLMARYIRRGLLTNASAADIKTMTELHMEECMRVERAARRAEGDAKAAAKEAAAVEEVPTATEDPMNLVNMARETTTFRSECGRYTIIFPNVLLANWTPEIRRITMRGVLSNTKYEARVEEVIAERGFLHSQR